MVPITEEVIQKLEKIHTGSISNALDRLGMRRGFMSHQIRPIYKTKIIGPAVTVLMKPSVGLPFTHPIRYYEAIDEAAEKSILVIGATKDARNVALWGCITTTVAKERGLSGAILDGGVRDIDEAVEL